MEGSLFTELPDGIENFKNDDDVGEEFIGLEEEEVRRAGATTVVEVMIKAVLGARRSTTSFIVEITDPECGS